MSATTNNRWASRVALACVLLFAWYSLRHRIYQGWISYDEGVQGEGAVRVLRGELPHRDFIALWSGGLDALHAAIFRRMGTSLAHFRTLLLYSWLGALAAYFATARRFLSPWTAAALTIACAEWTLMMWGLPMPSWYVLFLALAGTAATARFLDTRGRGWLVLAGLAAGSSCAVKITGLYIIAATALFFVWLVQEETPVDADRRGLARPYAWVITVGLLGYLGLVGALIAPIASANSALHFAMPSGVLVAYLTIREWQRPSEKSAVRCYRLTALVAPFAAGVIVALALWLAPYAAAGALGDVFRGLFVTPAARFSVSTYPLPGLRSSALAVLALVVLIAGAPLVQHPLRPRDRAALWLVMGALVAACYPGAAGFPVAWNGFRLMTPACTLLGVWSLATTDARYALIPARRQLVFFLVAAATMSSFVQIPFALYTYFLYFAPLLLLALAALVTSQPSMPRDVPAALLSFLMVFGYRNPGAEMFNWGRAAPSHLAQLVPPRGGIAVSPADSALYAAVIAAVERHDPGEWIYVWHDAPELYYLTGKRNPTRTMFEQFDDARERSTPFLRDQLRRHDVRVLILTSPMGAVRPMAPDFRAWIDSAFPGREQVSQFEVRWRDLPLGPDR